MSHLQPLLRKTLNKPYLFDFFRQGGFCAKRGRTEATELIQSVDKEGCLVYRLGFWVKGFAVKVYRMQGLGSEVSGMGFRVGGLGMKS